MGPMRPMGRRGLLKKPEGERLWEMIMTEYHPKV